MRPDAVTDLDSGAVRRICQFVQEHTGIQLPATKHTMVTARLSRRLRELRLTDIRAYLKYVEQHSEELTSMVDLLTTNKTSFFRDSPHFDVLAEHLGQLAAGGVEPAIWSAGCSSGEEPYSIAMTAAAVGVRNERLLATDLSTRMLATARAGKYMANECTGISGRMRQAYFLDERPFLTVRPELRERISFARLNLMEAWPMRGPFHAIFCRNVMIYFDKPTRERLVSRFRELLVPGGLFFVGLSESVPTNTSRLRLVQPGVYRK